MDLRRKVQASKVKLADMGKVVSVHNVWADLRTNDPECWDVDRVEVARAFLTSIGRVVTRDTEVKIVRPVEDKKMEDI